MVSVALAQNSRMLCETEQRKHLGDRVRIKGGYDRLSEVEQYFYNQCMRRRIHTSYDCTAGEPLAFQTINYTTFAGVFYMHPLQPELNAYQINDAALDDAPLMDFEKFFMDNYKAKSANKYTFATRSKCDVDCDAVVVLPGTNKLYSSICLNKLKWIAANYPNAVFKPHPLTHDDVVKEIKEHLPGATVAPYDSDLYELVEKADTVFTSHLSESAMYAALLGKRVEPIDVLHERHVGAFAAINYSIFMGKGAGWINKVCSSPRSGLVHPDVDIDWKVKVDTYLDYILDLRERVSSHYII